MRSAWPLCRPELVEREGGGGGRQVGVRARRRRPCSSSSTFGPSSSTTASTTTSQSARSPAIGRHLDPLRVGRRRPSRRARGPVPPPSRPRRRSGPAGRPSRRRSRRPRARWRSSRCPRSPVARMSGCPPRGVSITPVRPRSSRPWRAAGSNGPSAWSSSGTRGLENWLDEVGPDFEFTPDPSFPDAGTYRGEASASGCATGSDLEGQPLRDARLRRPIGDARLMPVALASRGAGLRRGVPVQDFTLVVWWDGPEPEPQRMAAFFDPEQRSRAAGSTG